VKNIGILAAWIAGIILFGWFLLFFTQSVRNDRLMRSVNTVLSLSGDTRQLERSTSKTRENLGINKFGIWYTVADSDERVIVFTIMNDGISIPCIAIIDNDNGIEILPLNSYAKSVYEDIPKGRLDIYIRRIEKEIKK
jgi:hypothetical protein